MPSWRWVAAGLALAGYALLSHGLMVLAGDKPWAVAALLAPLLLAVGGVAWRQRQLPTLLVCLGLLGALTWIGASGQAQSINGLYLLQHAGIHLALACVFASTLRRGATPLITALAARMQGVHAAMTPDKARYTRRVTKVWTGYFAGMVVLSLALYVWAPWWVWSLFANLFTPLAVVTLFVGEHALRYRLHPEFERLSMLQTLQAYRSAPLPGARRP
jgi:uncharacterized membrane protein